jgi:hypothetical protein
LLAEIFNDSDGAALLVDWLKAVGIEAAPGVYGITDAPARIAAALSSTRGRNFIGASSQEVT